jgi:cobalt-zinc-cadmium efflux system membrane fusion protein
MDTKPRSGPPLVVAALGAVALAGAVWWFSPVHAKAADADKPPAVVERIGGQVVVGPSSPLRRTLAIQPVTEQTIEATIALPAMVEADSARLVKVLPPLPGRIASLDKRLGDSVQRGDVLFSLESADLGQALSDQQKARAALALARQTLARQRDLRTSDIAATRDVEQAQSDFEQAASELGRAEARLAQLGATALGASDPNAVRSRVVAVRSPIAGRVVDLSAAAGAYWNDATAPLMTVADLSTVFVIASADEKDSVALFVGQSARVGLDAYPGEALAGKVRYVGELLDPDTRRVKVRMQFDNRDGRLKPGMFAKATFLAKAHQGLLVPLTAVVQSGLYARVFVEVQPWRFEPRVVQLGARVGDRVEIVSGLKANERVVVKDGVLLDD